MEQTAYTPDQVLALEDHFKSMIHSVITDMLHAGDPSRISLIKEYTLIEGVTYTFVFKTNPLKHIESLGDKGVQPPNVATACTHIGNYPWSINFEQSDFESPVEDILRHPTVDLMIKMFMMNVITHMSRSFYGSGLQAKVQAAINDQNSEAVTELSEGLVHSVYSENGYRVALIATDAEGKPETIIDDSHFQKHPRNNSLNTEKDICSRYTHEAFILALGTGLLMKDQWTATII